MEEQILLRSDVVEVTPTLVRFGQVSYQISNISSVAVQHRRKINGIALFLALTGIGLGLLAYLLRERQADQSLWAAIAAIVVFLAGVAWQQFRPVYEYQFVIRTAGGETEGFTSFDRAHVMDLRAAIERAIAMRRYQSQ